jgi:phospholipase C
MITRRELLKNGLVFSQALGVAGVVPPVIAKAYAITPDPGTTYLDAEHIVILMQENRSFDHMFGTLSGVRGFDDPRAMRQADGLSIFLQRDRNGNAHPPWHANLTESRATWMGALPHSRDDQIDAWNGGAHNNWIEAKRYSNKEYADIPGTMSYVARDDIPFYYALADAFTVCDQYHCSLLTSTAPNRLMMWSGTVREEHEFGSLVYLRNDQTWPGALKWTTYPERLQQAGISWKCYQNQIRCESPLSGDAELWLGNYGDNSLERFDPYPVHFSPAYRERVDGVIDSAKANLTARQATLRQELARVQPSSSEARQIEALIQACTRQIESLEAKRNWGERSLDDLSDWQRELRARAFQNNSGDPNFQALTTLEIERDGKTDRIAVPKGDVLHQFRQDVKGKKLPTVSWLVAPARFSDHPSSPWYGAWYVSEVLKILTEDPQVWKKTIFILTYDENDGYFDHAPSFVAADPQRSETGGASAGIEISREYSTLEDELLQGVPAERARGGPLGLGYRVPTIIASPWSRGGWVNSQLFDHTSILQFLETFIAKKFGKNVAETNISSWRRTICGNLVSCFRQFESDGAALPFLSRDSHVERIAQAQHKPLPAGFRTLDSAALAVLREKTEGLREVLWQEPGTRPACALPYELHADAAIENERTLDLRLEASNRLFGKDAAGGAFNVYLYGVEEGCQARPVGAIPNTMAGATYVVRPGDVLTRPVEFVHFSGDRYDVVVHGPNGFYRHFIGRKTARPVRVQCRYQRVPGRRAAFRIALTVENASNERREIEIRRLSYEEGRSKIVLSPGKGRTLFLNIAHHHHWYDFSVACGDDFEWRYAGRVETGGPSVTDPLIGRPRRDSSKRRSVG